MPDPLGVDWIVQLVPFQRSASVLFGELPVVAYPPTAVQAVDELHATHPSPSTVDPAGLGVARIVQLEPFHRSASVWVGSMPPPVL